MADKDIEQPAERPQPVPPWWAGIGRRGALALVVFGGAVAAWIFLEPVVGLPSLPFVPDEATVGYYQAAKIAAIGLVILGTALFAGRRRGAGAEASEAPEASEASEAGRKPAQAHEG